MIRKMQQCIFYIMQIVKDNIYEKQEARNIMVKYYRTDDRMIREVDKLDSGAWAYMVSPTTEEAQEIAERLDVDLGDIFAAVDKEESARIELEDGYTKT